MDATLWTLLTLLALATVLALIRSRRRDRCLRDFDGFTVTLAEQGGDLVWGRACVYPTGIEIEYETPVVAPAGHLERSFIFYRDQFEAMERSTGMPKADARSAAAPGGHHRPNRQSRTLATHRTPAA